MTNKCYIIFEILLMEINQSESFFFKTIQLQTFMLSWNYFNVQFILKIIWILMNKLNLILREILIIYIGRWTNMNYFVHSKNSAQYYFLYEQKKKHFLYFIIASITFQCKQWQGAFKKKEYITCIFLFISNCIER